MQEPYGEGVASHTGPESCAGAREGAGEALTGVRAGRLSSRERSVVRGADAVFPCGRPHRVRRHTPGALGPRAVEDPVHARKLLAQELGDPSSDLDRWWRGPHRESFGSTTVMYGRGKSDRPVVLKTPANNRDGAPPWAERVEGRGLAKGNPPRHAQSRTQRRMGSDYGDL